MLAAGVLEREPDISDDDLLDVLASNLCRCTGYENIVKAVRAAAAKMAPRPVRADDAGNESPTTSGSGCRSRGWRTRRWSRGHGRFAADISFPHQLHMRVVRSESRARTHRVDRYRPPRAPVRAWSRSGPRPTLRTFRRSISAKAAFPRSTRSASRCWRPNRVRYVGEPVAAVFAHDPYLAEDAADLVSRGDRGAAGPARRRCRARRVLARPQHRGGDHPPGLWRRRRRPASPRRCWSSSSSRSAAIPACRWKHAARSAATMPSRDILELHGAAKVPHRNRDLLARMLERPPSSIHVHESHVGGGFGIRGELYPEDVLVCVAAMRLGRPVKWIEDRREHLDRRQSLAPAAAPHSRGDRWRGPHPRHRRSLFSRPGRLCAHPCRARRAHDRGHTSRSLSRAGLSRGRAFPADQQDAGGHLSRARTLRDHVRARAADRRDRGEARHRSQRRAPPQRHLEGRDALSPAAGGAGRGDRARFRRLRRPARQAPGAARMGQAQGRSRAPPRRRRSGRRRLRDVRGEERARPRRWRADRGRYLGRSRADHRRRLARPGLRDRDGAGLRRDARRRLPARARHPRPDRPHRLRHRRACIARDRDDGIRHPQRRAEAARQGDRGRRRADAGAGRRARHRRRQGGAQGSAVGTVDEPRRDRPAPRADLEDAGRIASRACRPKAGSGSSTRSIPTASISRW